MEQPQAPGDAKLWDTIITSAVGLFGILGGWLIRRAKVRAEADKSTITIRSAIEKDYLDGSKEFNKTYREEAEEAREEAAKERAAGLQWMAKALALEAKIPFMEGQIAELREANKALMVRVADLEKQIRERSQWEDVR